MIVLRNQLLLIFLGGWDREVAGRVRRVGNVGVHPSLCRGGLAAGTENIHHPVDQEHQRDAGHQDEHHDEHMIGLRDHRG